MGSLYVCILEDHNYVESNPTLLYLKNDIEEFKLLINVLPPKKFPRNMEDHIEKVYWDFYSVTMYNLLGVSDYFAIKVDPQFTYDEVLELLSDRMLPNVSPATEDDLSAMLDEAMSPEELFEREQTVYFNIDDTADYYQIVSPNGCEEGCTPHPYNVPINENMNVAKVYFLYL